MNRLLTKKLLADFLKQGDTSMKEAKEILVLAHFTMGFANWYAAEYFPEDNVCFGYVNLGDDNFAELGDFSLDELAEMPGVIRNDNWKPVPLQEIMDNKGHLKPNSSWSPTKRLKR
jgi:hypothetical protein